MLNKLEKRILKYMISQDSDGCIPINFSDVSTEYRKEAVKSLAQQGYVLSACSITSAAAILTEKGKYFMDEETKFYGAYADKISQLENYIYDGQHLMELHDKNRIVHFINNMIAVYGKEIGSSTVQDIQIKIGIAQDSDTEICENELSCIVGILNKILNETKIEASKQNSVQYVNNVSQTVTQNVNIEINLSIVINDINKTDLNEEDKDTLIRLLAKADSCKSKKKGLWDKVKEVMKFLLDKGIEVAAIVLPYLAHLMPVK